MKSLINSLPLTVLLAWTSPALAIDPLSAFDLLEFCDVVGDAPDSDEARLCSAYVNGFLDGSVATDERVAENVVSEFDEKETFSERAIRTRVINRMRDYGPSVYAEFCVGQPVPVAEVIAHVLDELERHQDLDSIPARSIVDASLRRHYPCVPEQDSGD